MSASGLGLGPGQFQEGQVPPASARPKKEIRPTRHIIRATPYAPESHPSLKASSTSPVPAGAPTSLSLGRRPRRRVAGLHPETRTLDPRPPSFKSQRSAEQTSRRLPTLRSHLISLPPTATVSSSSVALSWKPRLRPGVRWSRSSLDSRGWRRLSTLYDCGHTYVHRPRASLLVRALARAIHTPVTERARSTRIDAQDQ